MFFMDLQKFYFFTFVTVFILSNFAANSIYYVNSTDNAVVWRNKLLKLHKLWLDYPMFELQHCVSKIGTPEATVSSVLEEIQKVPIFKLYKMFTLISLENKQKKNIRECLKAIFISLIKLDANLRDSFGNCLYTYIIHHHITSYHIIISYII